MKPRRRKRRMVSAGPSTASGGMTTLTREPSGSRASASGDGLVDAAPGGREHALDHVAQLRLGGEGDAGRLEAPARARPRRGAAADHDLVDLRVLEQRLQRPEAERALGDPARRARRASRRPAAPPRASTSAAIRSAGGSPSGSSTSRSRSVGGEAVEHIVHASALCRDDRILFGRMRDAILDAGLRAFLRDGVAGAPIQHIAADAGVSIGGLVPPLRRQARARRRHLRRRAAPTIRPRSSPPFASTPTTPRRAVRAIVAAPPRLVPARRSRTGPASCSSTPTRPGRVAEALEALNRAFFGEVLALVAAARPLRRVRDLDLDLAYALWLGPAQEYCRLQLAGRTTVDPARRRARTGRRGVAGPLKRRSPMTDS